MNINRLHLIHYLGGEIVQARAIPGYQHKPKSVLSWWGNREQSPSLGWRVPDIAAGSSMVHLSPPAICPKADLFHWDLCQGSSREPLPQIESTDLGHSPWPTGADWLHQQPEGHSVEWKASGCCPLHPYSCSVFFPRWSRSTVLHKLKVEQLAPGAPVMLCLEAGEERQNSNPSPGILT